MKPPVNVKHKMHTSFSIADHGCQNARTKVTGRVDCISCFHAEAESYAKDSEEEYQRDETSWRWGIPLIRYRKDRNNQHGGPQKLEMCELV